MTTPTDYGEPRSRPRHEAVRQPPGLLGALKPIATFLVGAVSTGAITFASFVDSGTDADLAFWYALGLGLAAGLAGGGTAYAVPNMAKRGG